MGQQSMLAAVWFTLTVVGDWLMFRKAGRAGILSVIPLVNLLVEYSICWRWWSGALYVLLLIGAGICAIIGMEFPSMLGVAAALGLSVLIISWIESGKLARAFGKGFGYGLFLFFFGRVARVILGLGNARYRGRR